MTAEKYKAPACKRSLTLDKHPAWKKVLSMEKELWAVKLSVSSQAWGPQPSQPVMEL